MQLTLSATFFWPAFFALGWMQYRFLDLEFPVPGLGFSLGYIGIFIIIYIIAYMLFKQIKRRLPHCLASHAPPDGGPGSGPADLLPSGRESGQSNV